MDYTVEMFNVAIQFFLVGAAAEGIVNIIGFVTRSVFHLLEKGGS